MGNLKNVVVLFLVIKCVVSIDSDFAAAPLTSNQAEDVTKDKVETNNLFLNIPSNSFYGEDDIDENEENESTQSIVGTIQTLIERNPSIISPLMESENLSQLPSLIMTIKRQLIREMARELGFKLPSLNSPLFSQEMELQTYSRRRLIEKLMYHRLEGMRAVLKRLGDILGRGNNKHEVVGRRIQKRSLPSFFEIFRRLWNPKGNLEDRLSEIINTNNEEFFNSVETKSVLYPIQDKELASDVKEAIKTDDTDEGVFELGIEVPESKEDLMVIQNWTNPDTMYRFLKKIIDRPLEVI